MILQFQFLSHDKRESILHSQKNRNLDIYDSMTPGQTASAEEDSVIRSKVPGQLGCLREIVSNHM